MSVDLQFTLVAVALQPFLFPDVLTNPALIQADGADAVVESRPGSERIQSIESRLGSSLKTKVK